MRWPPVTTGQRSKSVKKSIEKILDGVNPATVIPQERAIWYRELRAPSVTTCLLHPAWLAGYRNGPVHISRSMHSPPAKEAVRDLSIQKPRQSIPVALDRGAISRVE